MFTGVSAENDKAYTNGEDNIYELVFSADIDGVIIAANRFRDMNLKNGIFRRLDAMGIPAVAIEEGRGNINGIFPDQSGSIAKITEHLISVHRYRDIICLTGPQGNREAENRADGYTYIMKKHRLDSSVLYGDFWRNSAAELAKDIADGKRPRPEARATYLLRNTSMSVQRIAEECGYTNAAHFMRQFREREGMSAGQYRKAEKNE